jgi:hypothetical protein
MTPLNGVDFEAIAQEIYNQKDKFLDREWGNDCTWEVINEKDFIKTIAQAFKEAFDRGVAETEKRLLLSRVQLPERKTPADLEDYNAHLFNACLDSIKLVPMNLDELIPSEDTIMETDKIDWDDPLGVYYFIRAHIQAALGEKKDGEM